MLLNLGFLVVGKTGRSSGLERRSLTPGTPSAVKKIKIKNSYQLLPQIFVAINSHFRPTIPANLISSLGPNAGNRGTQTNEKAGRPITLPTSSDFYRRRGSERWGDLPTVPQPVGGAI